MTRNTAKDDVFILAEEATQPVLNVKVDAASQNSEELITHLKKQRPQ